MAVAKGGLIWLSTLPPDYSGGGKARANVYNVDNNHPEQLTHVVSVLLREPGCAAVREMLPMQPET